jgi:hypothetical protein
VLIESNIRYSFSNMQPEYFDPNNAGGQALLVFTYLAFFFSLRATLSSVLLADSGNLSEVCAHLSQRGSPPRLPKALVMHKATSHHEAPGGWRPVMCHCTLSTILTLPTFWHLHASVGFAMFLIGYLFAMASVTCTCMGNAVACIHNPHVMPCLNALASPAVNASIPVVKTDMKS